MKEREEEKEDLRLKSRKGRTRKNLRDKGRESVGH